MGRILVLEPRVWNGGEGDEEDEEHRERKRERERWGLGGSHAKEEEKPDLSLVAL